MKTFSHSIRIFAAIGALFAISNVAFAATKTFNGTPPIAASPALITVFVGTATNVTTTVTIKNGSSGSTSFKGIAQLTATSTNSTVTTVLSATNFNFSATSLTWSPTLTVSNTATTPLGAYTIQLVADTNNPFSGDNIVPVTNTFILVVATPSAFVPQTIWTPAGVNSNWSTAANWTENAAPVSSNDVDFFDNSGAPNTPGTLDNIVDANLFIGSLTYGQTNTTHTTQINPGVTLTVGGDANGLVAGTRADNGGITTFSTVTGSTLVVSNRAANVFVSQSTVTINNAIAQAQATLDLSGLNNFTATFADLLVGVDLTIKGASGQLNLAKTNVITCAAGSIAPQIDVGDNSQASGSPAIPSVLLLGQTNSFFVDSIDVGRGKTDNSGYQSYQGPVMAFNSAFNSPSVYFRGTNGVNSRVGTWSIGDGGSARTYYAYGTCDFSLGTVNALVGTMNVGIGSTSTQTTPDAGNGFLTMAAGTMDIITLNIGINVKGAGSGTANVNGGTLLVDSLLEMADGGGSSGTLNISNGTVTANSGIVAGGGAAVITMTGGALSVSNANATVGTAASPLNTLVVSNSTLTLAVQTLLPSVAAQNLGALGAANTINISTVPVLTGFPSQFPVIQYGLNSGSASGNTATFVLGTLPAASPAYGAYISNNVANNSIDIVFTNGPFVPALTWDGEVNGNWDLTTTNWRATSGPDTSYANGDFVTFNDSLSGTPNVNLTTALTPGLLTISNSAASYVFSGSGSLGGSVTLVKYGSGMLSLAETGGDNFSGGVLATNGTLILDDAHGSITGGTTIIGGGTVQIGNNDTNGAVPGGSVSDDGTLAFDNANNITVTNTISGLGILTQNGTNIVALTGINSVFTGAAIASQGTLQIASTNSLLAAASGITVSNGATLDTFGLSLYSGSGGGVPVTVSGTGVGGNGALVNNSTNTQTDVFHVVNVAGDTMFGGVSGWDIRNQSGNSSISDGQLIGVNGSYNLTKVSSNTVTFRGVSFDGNLNNINVQGGGLHFTYTTTAMINSLGNSAGTITVYSNATVTLDTIGNIPSKNFVLTNGGTLACSSINTFGDPLVLSGAANNTISVGNGSQFTITSPITGSGGFSKNGSGPLFLNATNTYTGNTVISGGTLALYSGGSDGSISASALIDITGGATLDVSGRSDDTFTLASGQTLDGGVGTNAGVINGNFIASPGSAFTPGTGNTNTGSIAVYGSATLQGASILNLNAAAGTSDQLLASNLVYGGTLAVTNFSGTITNGQTFELFVASNGVYNAGSFSMVTLPSAPGLTWTNNLTSNGTITAGVVPVTPTIPIISGFSLTGTSFIMSGTSSTTNLSFTYSVLGTTNLLLPLTNWTVVSTGNAFNPGGNFRITNSASLPLTFYLLRVP